MRAKAAVGCAHSRTFKLKNEEEEEMAALSRTATTAGLRTAPDSRNDWAEFN